MTGDMTNLVNFKFEDGPNVIFGDNGVGRTLGYGTVQTGTVSLSPVAYVDGLKHNLLSISQLSDKGYKTHFTKQCCEVIEVSTGEVKLTGKRKGNVYMIHLEDIHSEKSLCMIAKASHEECQLWHRRFSHLNYKSISKLSSLNLVRGLPSLSYNIKDICSGCQLGKQTKSSFKNKTIFTDFSKPLDLIHLDLFGPMSTMSQGRKKYTLVVVDDFTRFTWVKFLFSKDETAEILIDLFKILQVQKSCKIGAIRSDHGTEFECAGL